MKQFVNGRILFAFALLAVVFLLYVFNVLPIVILKTPLGADSKFGLKKGQNFNPLPNVSSLSEICLLISRSDRPFLPSIMTNAKLLCTKDEALISEVRKAFIFEYTAADVATVESLVLFYEGNDLVFLSSIVVEKDLVALQSPDFGYAEAADSENLLRLFYRFKRIYKPFRVL